MKLASYLVLGLALVAASSCENEVKITDGKVPAAYLSDAATLMGVYSGTFGIDGRMESNTLTASLTGQTILLTASNDLIDARCGSTIGLLTSVGVTQDQKGNITIHDASFEFDAGLCLEVQGNQLTLNFNQPGQFTASIYDHSESRVFCTIGGGIYPVEQCSTSLFPIYRQGTFRN